MKWLNLGPFFTPLFIVSESLLKNSRQINIEKSSDSAFLSLEMLYEKGGMIVKYNSERRNAMFYSFPRQIQRYREQECTLFQKVNMRY